MTSSDLIAGYRVLAPIDSGGMGTVFRARHDELGREVALKLLRSDLPFKQRAKARFQREMRLAAAFQHPNIVRVYDGGISAAGVPYLAMELIDGRTLESVCEEAGALAWPVALAILAQMASGLVYLHDAGVLHRDVKPDNLMMPFSGGLKLVDFGLAHTDEGTVVTDAGEVLGTPQYMAPELFLGDAASRESDLWSVGAVAYRLFAGAHHVAFTDMRTWPDALMQPIAPPSAHDPGLPRAIDHLVMSLLARDPKQRGPDLAKLEKRALELLKRHADITPAELIGAHVSREPSSVSARRSRIPVLGKWRKKRRPALKLGRGKAGWRSPRMVALAFGVPALILFLLLVVPARSVVGPAARPAVPATVALLFDGWRELAARQAELERDGTESKDLLARLRKRAKVDLGDRASMWAGWIRIGRWFQEPVGDPPRSPRAMRGPEHPFNEELTFDFLEEWIQPSGSVLAQILSLVVLLPDDGRSWLALSFWFDLEGDVPRSVTAFKLALPLLSGLDFDSSPEVFWRSLARGLDRTGRLETDWLRCLVDHRGDPEAWRALASELGPDGRGRLMALVDRALARPETREAAAVERGYRLEEQGDAEDARRIWNGVPKGRSYKLARIALYRHCLARGMLKEADLAGPISPAAKVSEMRVLLDENYGALTAVRVPRGIHSRRRAGLIAIEMRRELEQSNRRAVLDLMVDAARLSGPQQDNVHLEIAADGVEVSGFEPAFVRSIARAGTDPEAFDRVASLLASPYGRRRGFPALPRLLRALAASRSGDDDRALADVAEIAKTALDEAERRALYEIVTRPLWRAAAGLPVKTTTLSRARALVPAGALDRAWRAVTENDPEQRLTLASQAFDARPGTAALALGRVYATAAAGDAKRLRAATEQALVVHRYHGFGPWFRRELERLTPPSNR